MKSVLGNCQAFSCICQPNVPRDIDLEWELFSGVANIWLCHVHGCQSTPHPWWQRHLTVVALKIYKIALLAVHAWSPYPGGNHIIVDVPGRETVEDIPAREILGIAQGTHRLSVDSIFKEAMCSHQNCTVWITAMSHGWCLRPPTWTLLLQVLDWTVWLAELSADFPPVPWGTYLLGGHEG